MKKVKDSIAKELQNAQLYIVERALLAFVEDLLGRCPTDDEILRLGFHMAFAATPLSVYEKDGRRFSQFYCFKNQLVALGFLDTNNLLALDIVRVPDDAWPTAVKLYVEQVKEKREKGPEA